MAYFFKSVAGYSKCAMFSSLVFCCLFLSGIGFESFGFSVEDGPIRTIENEVIRADAPDPTLLRRGNDFFLGVSSLTGGYLRIYHSTDMIHWRILDYVFDFHNKPKWIDQTAPNIWAGHYLYNEKTQLYYCYYSAKLKEVVSGNYGHAIAVAIAPSMDGPWTDYGPFYRGGGVNGKKLGSGSVIDSFIFFENDIAYMFCQEEMHGRWLVMGELTSDLLHLKPETLQMVHKTQPQWTSWENGVAEGNVVIKKNGKYILLYNGSSWAFGDNYAVGILTSPTIKGPWTPHPDNPFFPSDEVIISPGILKSLTQFEDGNWWTFHHGYLSQRGTSLCRTTFLDRVEWSKDDVPRMKKLKSFEKERPPVGSHNLVVFGDFSCGSENIRPWTIEGRVWIKTLYNKGKYAARLFVDKNTQSSSLTQTLKFLPSGDYRVCVEMEAGKSKVEAYIMTDKGKTLASKIIDANTSKTLQFDFTKKEDMSVSVSISLKALFQGNQDAVVIKSVRMVEVFTRELQAEYGAKSGKLAVPQHANASMESYYPDVKHPGQEVHFPTAKIPSDDIYTATLRYGTVNQQESGSLNLYINKKYTGTLHLPPTGEFANFQEISVPVQLSRGDNLIALKYEAENSGNMSIDVLRLSYKKEKPVTAKGFLEILPLPQAIDSFSRYYYNPPERNNWRIMGIDNKQQLVDLKLLPSLFYTHPDDFWCKGNLTWICPGQKNDIAIVWKAQKSAKVFFSSPVIMNHQPQSDGIRIRVMRNTEQVWPKTGWKLFNPSKAAIHDDFRFKTTVKKGDNLIFQVNRKGNNVSDITYTDPYIACY